MNHPLEIKIAFVCQKLGGATSALWPGIYPVCGSSE